MAITFPTFEDAIQKTILQLSMVPGTSVQTYAEDIIGAYVQSAFNDVFDLRFWPRYSSWITVTLDGVVGIPNVDIDVSLRRYEDIARMFRGSTNDVINALPGTINPSTITGTTAQFRAPYNTDSERIFRVYPSGSTGTLDLYVRTKPEDFVTDSEIKLDIDLLVLKACWFYSIQDGANSGQAATFNKRFTDRLSIQAHIIDTASPIPINPSAITGIPSEWQ